MPREAAGFGLVMWLGAALLLSASRRLSRPTLVDRLRPHVAVAPGSPPPPRRPPGVRGAIEAVVEHFGLLAGLLARATGTDDPVAHRLARIHSPLDSDGFRLRQLGWALGALGMGAAAGLALRVPAPAGLAMVLGAPVGAIVMVEHRLTTATRRWQRRVERELPVVAEQLAMLVGAGYSTGSALSRIARRGHGRVATDLACVCARVGQGLALAEALGEWAARARVPAVDHLARVLVRGPETADLGRQLSIEARSMRRELQRRLVAEADRRTQAVWIPVTVAALVPGVIFLALPFLHALRAFAGP